METFALLGFVFGMFAFSQVLILPNRIKALEQRVIILEERIREKEEDNLDTDD
ncbi:hypothetical protein [Vallitalea okinawensis]|uniref:hypothetical protein n=1 Tax=Vallitalea okinawensis TaxID=2078660 RepID=UPI00130022C6|nr:hypothetical protein [Vallitalea okinawensis]